MTFYRLLPILLCSILVALPLSCYEDEFIPNEDDHHLDDAETFIPQVLSGAFTVNQKEEKNLYSKSQGSTYTPYVSVTDLNNIFGVLASGQNVPSLKLSDQLLFYRRATNTSLSQFNMQSVITGYNNAKRNPPFSSNSSVISYKNAVYDLVAQETDESTAVLSLRGYRSALSSTQLSDLTGNEKQAILADIDFMIAALQSEQFYEYVKAFYYANNPTASKIGHQKIFKKLISFVLIIWGTTFDNKVFKCQFLQFKVIYYAMLCAAGVAAPPSLLYNCGLLAINVSEFYVRGCPCVLSRCDRTDPCAFSPDPCCGKRCISSYQCNSQTGKCVRNPFVDNPCDDCTIGQRCLNNRCVDL